MSTGAGSLASGSLQEASARALRAIDSFLDEAVKLRHAIHADPRVGGQEQHTRALIRRATGPLPGSDLFEGLLIRVGPAGRPAVGIRAELDALPIQEISDLPWRSATPGVAHLCGHDVHAAALTAVVRTLSHIGAPIPLVALFQPREEVYPSGAADFTENGVIHREDIAAMVAVHLHPGIPDGSFSSAPGTINASSDNFSLTVHGQPAHGAYPHLARDPILAAAAIVQGLQQLVSRRVDPMRPAVVTVGRISGGTSANAIPADVTLEGTLRAHDPADRALLLENAEQVARLIAEGHGCRVAFTADRGEPALKNDRRLAERVAARLVDEGFVQSAPIRTCGADDFAFFGDRVPSLMVFAGTGTAKADSPGLHHPAFVPQDSSVAIVARIMLLAYFSAAETLLEPAPRSQAGTETRRISR